MRKVIASIYVTLDGVMEEPAWTMPFWNDELAKYAHEQLFASDALLLGRVTYQGFAAAWPSMTDDEGFADRMNSLPKFVVSGTLGEAVWNNANLIRDNVAEEVSSLKQKPGQDILIYGSGELVGALMQHGLIDECRLWVFPTVLGNGKRLFREGSEAIALNLVETKTFRSGVVLLAYRPEKNG